MVTPGRGPKGHESFRGRADGAEGRDAIPGRTSLVDSSPESQGLGWEPIDPQEYGGGGDDVVPHQVVAYGDTSGSKRSATKPKPKPTTDAGYDALLIEALTKGDVPIAEFENFLRQLDEPAIKAVFARLSVNPPPTNDKLAITFYQTVSERDRKRIVQYMADVNKSYASTRMWGDLAPGEDTKAKKLVSRVDAFDGVKLREHPAGKEVAVLPFDTLVSVSQETSKGWYYVTVIEGGTGGTAPVGASGFVENYHVASEMPEPTARLHKVKPNQLLKDIAAQYYKHNFAWGHDARVFVQAIYHANKNRDVVFRQKTDLSVNQEALETHDLQKALELWGQARVVEGQALWMPSLDFVNSLKAAGVINNASISKKVWDATAGALQDLVDFLQYTGGFIVGLLEGAWGALEDLFTGVVDLVKMIWTVIKDIFTGFSEIKAFAKKIDAAWKNRDEILQQLATDFSKKWDSPDDWDRGNFQGEVLGYVMMTAFITLVTMGAGTAIVGAGRFGSFIKLIKFADAAGDIGTYAKKLAGAVKLPKHVLDKSKDALVKKTMKVATPDADAPKLHGDTDAPTVDGPRVPDGETPKVPNGGLPDAPHTHRPPQKNAGPDYKDPIHDPDAPHRYLEKTELPTLGKVDTVDNFKKIENQVKKYGAVAVGKKLASVDEGHKIIEQLARGDTAGLDALGMKKVPKDYDPSGREWALVEAKDGIYVYAGRYQDVQLPAGVRVHAHNHPSPRAPTVEPKRKLKPGEQPESQFTTQDLATSYDGKTYKELLDADSRNVGNSGLAPSVADIHQMSDGGTHVIYTRFVHRGGGKIANPVPGDAAARVAIHMSGCKVIRKRSRTKEFLYQVSVEIKDVNGKSLWSGELFAEYSQIARGGTLHYNKPAILDRPSGTNDWVDVQ